METKKYEIGDKTYTLLGPVFGVLEHVAACLSDTESMLGAEDLREWLGDKTPYFIAGLLCQEGTNPAERDLDAMAIELRWNLTGAKSREVMEDFFATFDPAELLGIGFVVNSLTGMAMTQKQVKAGRVPQQEFAATSVSSQEETSPAESKSGGDTDTQTPETTLNTP